MRDAELDARVRAFEERVDAYYLGKMPVEGVYKPVMVEALLDASEE